MKTKLNRLVTINASENPNIDDLMESTMYTFSNKTDKVFYSIYENLHYTIPKIIDIPNTSLHLGQTVTIPTFEMRGHLGQSSASSDYGQQDKKYQIVVINELWDTEEGGFYHFILLENQ